jgi:hypothetical protein
VLPSPEPPNDPGLVQDEHAVKIKELEVRRLEAEKALLLNRAHWWRKADPLVLAIIAGIFTLIGNMLVAVYNNNGTIRQEEQKNRNSLSQIERKASDDLALERQKARYTLILQAIATNDEKIAQRNIEFFIDAGILDDPDKKIQQAIPKYKPVLPGPSSTGNVPPTLRVAEIARLYDFPPGLDGSGQIIGLVEFEGGFDVKDLNSYFVKNGLPTPVVIAVPVYGGRNKPDDVIAAGQVMLDIEVVGTVAPKAQIRVYFAPWSAAGYSAAIRQAISDNVSVISTGWGQTESLWKDRDIDEIEKALESAAHHGLTITAALGSDGVTNGEEDNRPHVDFPASSPWVLAVGGTSITLTSGQLDSEVVWKKGSGLRRDGGGATGGGVSEKFTAPEWQSGIAPLPRSDGKVGRGVPDVAAVADYNIVIQMLGHETATGGTSVSTAIWAGLIALLNQGIGHNLGYFNPLLYREIGPAGVLRAVTKGDNGVKGVPGYSAGPGWNAVAGWGAPDGRRLLDWLRRRAASGGGGAAPGWGTSSGRHDRSRKHTVAGLAHAAFEHIAHAELAPDLPQIRRFALVRKARITGDDKQPG